MLSRFRGTFLGVLAGDSIGSLFEEGEILNASTRLILKNFITKLEGPPFTAPAIKFTDDTALTKSVANILLNYNEDYQKSLAKGFVDQYFKDPYRSYGKGVISIFNKLKGSEFEDVTVFARNQFDGTGSFGNGASMRISPVALYCFNKSDEFLIDLVTKTSEITHFNRIGINGAILQAFAILQNLRTQVSNFNADDYINELTSKMEKIDEEGHFIHQLVEVKKLLDKNFEPSEEEVVNRLGNSVNALFSVPTAIYSFLKCSKLASKSPNDAFRKTLEYTITLGGDADTITSMSCSLAGSLYGVEAISENLVKHLEAHEEMISLADKLYNVVAAS